MKSKIFHRGRTIELGRVLTPEVINETLQKEIGSNRKLAIAKGSGMKPLSQIASGTDLGSEVNIKDYPGGTGKGLYSREEYIKAHVASVAEVYGARYGQPIQLDKNLNFVFIPCFTLPKRWAMRTTPILIWFPKQYPQIPPNGFYLSKKCNGPHVYSRNVYGDSPDLSGKGWNWYCVHCDAGWHPGENPSKEDNLWTFFNVARMSLSIREF